MTTYGGRPDQARRDAITVEIGYALFSAAFAAVVLFGAVAGPAMLFDLPATLERVLIRLGLGIAPVLFTARVISVLIRFHQDTTRPHAAQQPAQPSQPGRTNPDS